MNLRQIPTFEHENELPARYTHNTAQVALALGLRNTSGVYSRVDRLHNPMPHARVKRKMLIAYYFDPLEVAKWLERY